MYYVFKYFINNYKYATIMNFDLFIVIFSQNLICG